jgi:glycosyltransferase involved in cell wall biosynthesis
VKIAFLSPDVPFPVRHGGHVRTFGLIRSLSSFATLHVLAVGDPADASRPKTRAAFEALGATIQAFRPLGPGHRLGLVSRRPHALWHYDAPSLRAALRAETADIVHVEEAVMAQYAGAVAGPAILDRQKIEWVYHRAVRHLGPGSRLSPLSWLRALRSRLEAARFHRWDLSLKDRFAAVLALGERDRRLLGTLFGAERVHDIPNGVDPGIALPSPRTSQVRFVLLYGSLDYPPNAEAHDQYFRGIWPLIRGATELKTLVVGGGPPLLPLPTGDPRIEIRGFVPDMMSVLGGPGVLVVPLRVGGGIRNKILEALAAGMPVVSTGVGAEGLDIEDGRHYLRADTPGDTAAAIVRLVQDPALVASLARAGSDHVESRYRWPRIAAALEPIYRRAAATRA